MICFYCGWPALRVAVVHEPTDDGLAYYPVEHVLCAECADTYEHPPWGFPVREGPR